MIQYIAARLYRRKAVFIDQRFRSIGNEELTSSKLMTSAEALSRARIDLDELAPTHTSRLGHRPVNKQPRYNARQLTTLRKLPRLLSILQINPVLLAAAATIPMDSWLKSPTWNELVVSMQLSGRHWTINYTKWLLKTRTVQMGLFMAIRGPFTTTLSLNENCQIIPRQTVLRWHQHPLLNESRFHQIQSYPYNKMTLMYLVNLVI